MKKVICDEEYCIGCKLCSVYCVTSHSRYDDPVLAYKREGLSGQERSRLQEWGAASATSRCRHCEDPLCVQACLTGALHRDPESGVVLHDEDKCVVCGTCMLACPLGGIVRQDKKKIIKKCDLCNGRSEPACVANCPNGALKVVEE